MRSMTGYGAGSADAPTARVSVEVRSVNQRFLDVKVSGPREYGPWERELRDRVRTVAQRGRVEVTVARAPVPARRRYAVAVRVELARAYVAASRKLAKTFSLEGALTIGEIFRLPDLLEVHEHPPDVRGELPALRRALARALRAFDAERRREGAHLRRDMQSRVAAVARAAKRIQARLPAALAALRRQAEERLGRFPGAGEIDPARVAQEAAVLADRADVTEEMVRLQSHLPALAAVLRQRGPAGKRMEFLLQEIHRELNTTGSKSGDLAVAELVLAAKAEVEKLREQVQNVE